MLRQAPRQPPRRLSRRPSHAVRPARPPLLATVLRRPARIGLILTLVVALVLLIRSFPEIDLVPSRPSKPDHHPIRFQPSSFDWSSLKQAHPVDIITPLPTGKPRSLRNIQHDFGPTYASDPATHSRQTAIRAAFVRSWEAYKKCAWLHDEITPVEEGWKDPSGGWAATLVDSLDTLWIMGLHADFRHAAAAAVQLDWGNCTTADGINVFETTIRHLGGFLSAYDLSGEEALLEKAKELGEMLFMAFDTPNRMPPFWMEFEKARKGKLQAGTWEPSSAAASLGLEFTRLAQLTGEDKFYDAIDRVRAFLNSTQEETRLPGMWPRHINFRSQNVGGDNTFTLGAGADSLYEYLPKMFLLTGGLEESYEKMYRRAMDVAVDHLLFKPMTVDNQDVLFSGNMVVHHSTKELVPKAQHLGCFAGGMLAMGGRMFDIPEHVVMGEQVMEGCVWAFEMFATGIMPEALSLIPCATLEGCDWDEERWKEEWSGETSLKKSIQWVDDTRYLLRPEAIESVFLLYRMTGRKGLRDMAWRMFESIQKATKTYRANSAIKDVDVEWDETEKTDSMESFWLSGTLKYLYLMYSHPDLINLDDWVFNTEGHPLRRPR